MTTREAPPRPSLASCRGVSVVYGHGESPIHALDSVDVEIEAGDGLALLGRSWSGKTTLLHVLGGLVKPTQGSVVWRGELLSSLDDAARTAVRARAIGYVFQSANLLPHFTAFENVAFAAWVGDGDNLTPAELLELVGLAGKVDHLPAELSGGEAQRAAIARALAQTTELLLCDEPTGHLDSATGERMLDLIEALQRELGFALVVATHDADLAARLPRRIELHDGRVVHEEQER